MEHAVIITEEMLSAQADYAESQGLIPDLILKLILASVPNPTELRLPVRGSVNQPGFDGLLEAISKTLS
jgi:hypothetical protein